MTGTTIDAATEPALTVDLSAERISITAYGEHGEQVGTAWCDSGSSIHPHPAEVHVLPDHRRRGVGTRLLRRLVEVASTHALGSLTWTHGEGDPAVDALMAASGVVFARRVDHGVAKTIIVVPAVVTP